MIDRDLAIGVDDDGLVDEPFQDVETRYLPCEGIYINYEHRFVGVIADDDHLNAETRIAFETLEEAGFTIPKEKSP